MEEGEGVWGVGDGGLVRGIGEDGLEGSEEAGECCKRCGEEGGR